jgi:hypothetical protein
MARGVAVLVVLLTAWPCLGGEGLRLGGSGAGLGLLHRLADAYRTKYPGVATWIPGSFGSSAAIIGSVGAIPVEPP